MFDDVDDHVDVGERERLPQDDSMAPVILSELRRLVFVCCGRDHDQTCSTASGSWRERSTTTSSSPTRVWVELAAIGVDMDDVAVRLETEGIASFKDPFDALIDTLHTKATRSREHQ